MKIRDMQRVPPHPGYDYTQLETGYVVASNSFWQLVGKVREHRKANGLPIPQEFAKQIENDWCSRHPQLCIPEDGDTPLTISKMLKGLLSDTTKWIKEGLPTVDEATLKERLEICDKCDLKKSWRGIGVTYCGRCGCAVGGGGKRTIKLHMATASCPDHKWGPVTK